jgi:hypothetical protein
MDANLSTGEITLSRPKTNSIVSEVLASDANLATVGSILSKLLTGFYASGGVIVATDTILQALQKAQGQINGLIRSSRPVTATGSLLATDNLIVVTGAGDVVLTLPSANAVGSGRLQEVVIKNLKSSGILTLQRAGSDSIYLYGGTTPQTNTNIPTGVAMVIFADGNVSWIVTV